MRTKFSAQILNILQTLVKLRNFLAFSMQVNILAIFLQNITVNMRECIKEKIKPV